MILHHICHPTLGVGARVCPPPDHSSNLDFQTLWILSVILTPTTSALWCAGNGIWKCETTKGKHSAVNPLFSSLDKQWNCPWLSAPVVCTISMWIHTGFVQGLKIKERVNASTTQWLLERPLRQILIDFHVNIALNGLNYITIVLLIISDSFLSMPQGWFFGQSTRARRLRCFFGGCMCRGGCFWYQRVGKFDWRVGGVDVCVQNLTFPPKIPCVWNVWRKTIRKGEKCPILTPKLFPECLPDCPVIEVQS